MIEAANEPITILYRNRRGETAVRRIELGRRDADGLLIMMPVWFGCPEWHPEEDWFLTAFDVAIGDHRDFVLSGIRAWGEAAVEEALAALASRPGAISRARERACFGRGIAADKVEPDRRFLEKALETVQAAGCTASEAHRLVDRVFGRRAGQLHQEVGGAMNALAALCLAHDLDVDDAGETRLARFWSKVEPIRAKQAAKPEHGPLPKPREWEDDDA